MNNFLFSTAAQKVWDFLCQNSHQSFYSAQVSQRTGVSRGGANQTLRMLAKQGLVQIEKKGRMVFYRVDARMPFIRQFKVLRNLALAEEVIKKVKVLSERVMLFGSSARGEDATESDVDLFIISREAQKIRNILPEFKQGRKVQTIIKTPEEYLALESVEPVFYQEIQKGIVLWQKE